RTLSSSHAPALLPCTTLFRSGMMFDEITASSLVKINLDGEVVDSSDRPINQAGFVIHSAVHEARPDAGCVIHLHTRDGVAVSARSEEHTSELQSRENLVCRLL